MNKKKRYEILSILSRNNPEPKIELFFSSDFELLLSVILSAQSTDFIVNKTTKILFKIANTPETIFLLGLERLKNYIKDIGLYNTKALNIIRTSFIILTKYNSIVPNNRIELESLPGVGRKTANIILNILFKKKTIAVDTHVFRVCNRTNFAKGKNVKIVEEKLIKVVPSIFKLNFHSWFILHGRYICTARKIKCNICLIFKLCEFKQKIF
ncbi:endonuclease III [Buchnera aphidicola str. APS (Acyrthosiphon pisum)]|uniref:Endonuclease III n=2 Tax=Buchnera aphidicola TaxID=9 RepID=END3_BUCAI|nr:endonuclease III [Buchnera aphidicola]P57219.1 RecName: Full=Endonuclease III; AltName: Full=DNA-(apurinic or apyrimidinic site) lyase [Buchnera aphidicola str. APS (Acyrthosiphon pisum)]pir/E84943/ DNA-(apurinic or apyrimidinic site) lyase (EC 4.2.99.18) [imported] - Buchnera sp. (strain APS) [Buchnera sp. (in: enterobacteria)]ADP66514.1 endonuclease III [Buchnera aphidicola str. TLW03 (Acyrthosiphon pisum)]ADP67664.1 endonuclease III [Buchnera aphidicola str. JF98 (Acyrthosiphon pisum)]AC